MNWNAGAKLKTENQMRMAIFLLLTITVFASCYDQSPTNIEAERSKILKLHELQRDYHFNKDSISFANQLSDNFISVNRGKITYPDKKETISKYHKYFSSVEFVKWDDVDEPIIRISQDGKLAYTIVNKIVKVSYKNENGNKVDQETHFAWTTIYKKYGNEWKIDCVTSTQKPN